MNRVDRLTAILVQLQSKKIVNASEIADRFDISLRTVYRDIRALGEGGIPVIGEAGTGYSIMDGYRLPPVMFTREEATAFLMGEKILDKYSDAHSANIYRAALYKVKAVLRTPEKDFISAIDNNIMVLKTKHRQPDTATSNGSLQTILTAISEKKVLSISYNSMYANESTTRCIEPVGIFLLNSHWYLIAWCRLRKDYRNFKTDRIRAQKITGETFMTAHISLAAYLDKTSREQQLHKAVIRIDKQVAKYIVTEKYYHGFASETVEDDAIEMTFLTAALEGMVRWYLMFGDQAEIIQPAELKQKVLELTAAIKKKLEP